MNLDLGCLTLKKKEENFRTKWGRNTKRLKRRGFRSAVGNQSFGAVEKRKVEQKYRLVTGPVILIGQSLIIQKLLYASRMFSFIQVSR